MARIAGVDIPRDKRVEIALTYIYGIGNTTSLAILEATQIDPSMRVKDLDENQLTRLREYIDRSREMYDKRVKAEVASRYDYFHGELVNTLAEGDPSKLGSNYPGATVNA